jgi:4'-phosphopantetheinyl transferase EntD
MGDRLFGAGVVMVTQDDLRSHDELFPEEMQAVERALPIRVREFESGRRCARAALAMLGCAPGPVLVGTHREPVWPNGYVGSITHCSGFCAAAVARSNPAEQVAIRSLGLDAEPARPLPHGLDNWVCTPRESDWIASQRVDQPWDRIFFSAKESAFKCIFPVQGRFLDYDDVQIDLDPASGEFDVHAAQTAVELRGRFILTPELVITAVMWTEGAACP